jgi:festuclavine dehydrogenase
LLTHANQRNQIAQILTQVLGRRVVHVPLHASELERRHRAYGMPEDYARLLGAMETAVKFGAEERTNDAVLAMTGTAPRRFRDFAAAMRDVWEGRAEPEEEGWF